MIVTTRKQCTDHLKGASGTINRNYEIDKKHAVFKKIFSENREILIWNRHAWLLIGHGWCMIKGWLTLAISRGLQSDASSDFIESCFNLS